MLNEKSDLSGWMRSSVVEPLLFFAVPVSAPVPTFEKFWFRLWFRLLKKLWFRFRFILLKSYGFGSGSGSSSISSNTNKLLLY
jgi:hypothetical protein